MNYRAQRRAAWIAFAALLLGMLYLSNAHAGLMGGVGVFMGPTSAGGSTPGGGFAILTESGQPLTTEAGNPLVTEAHP